MLGIPTISPFSFTEFNGNPITLYTYTKGSGTLANEQLNAPSNRPDTYSTILVSFAKRTSAKWSAAASFWDTKDHMWLNQTAGPLWRSQQLVLPH